jgi:hypothetical protein
MLAGGIILQASQSVAAVCRTAALRADAHAKWENLVAEHVFAASAEMRKWVDATDRVWSEWREQKLLGSSAHTDAGRQVEGSPGDVQPCPGTDATDGPGLTLPTDKSGGF